MSARDAGVVTPPGGRPFLQPADGTFLKWNLYSATESAAGYPAETLQRFAHSPVRWAAL